MGKNDGKGEYEYSEDGRIEKGSWVKNWKQGEFEITYKDGTTQKVMYENEDIDKSFQLIKETLANINFS